MRAPCLEPACCPAAAAGADINADTAELDAKIGPAGHRPGANFVRGRDDRFAWYSFGGRLHRRQG
jgi:hypothetical protein